MSDADSGAEGGASRRRLRSIVRVHYDLQPARDMARPRPAPAHVRAYDRQVAGHRASGDDYLGLLQCGNGTIMKPIIKEAQRREVEFYERVSKAAEGELAELRSLVPEYFGCARHQRRQCLVLEDLAKRMLEPCIMDVKIGRRTWDPLASEEKIASEQSKYALCKQQYGFCIPGFQVFRLESGQLCSYNKDYGKKLHGDAVKDAIRKFLNGRPVVCRALLLQLLAELWRIQTWARRQTAVRLYSTSVLLLYDAARLRDCCHKDESECSGGSGGGAGGPWAEALDNTHNHSATHSYSDTLAHIRRQYRARLDALAHAAPQQWARAALIDFAHAFFNDDDDSGGGGGGGARDLNLAHGLDSFVQILEDFLAEPEAPAAGRASRPTRGGGDTGRAFIEPQE